MTVRVTESRLPAGYLSSELGDAGSTVTLADGSKFVLVAFISAPVRTGTLQEYVLFAIGGDADEYRWTITDPNGTVVRTETTTFGCLEHQYTTTGLHEIQVEVVLGGAVTTPVGLLQVVSPPDNALEQYITQSKTQPEWADILRELRNDFAGYVQQASTKTGPNGVPTRLLYAILFQETMPRPKRGTALAARMVKTGEEEHIRENEIDKQAAQYEIGYPHMGPFITSPPFPRSLGPGQLGQARAAQLEGLLAWWEAPAGASPFVRKYSQIQDALDFQALAYEEQVDIFNLVRFPKTNITLVAKLLARLKNRANRWPNVAVADVIAEPNLVEIVATEYNLGPTASSATAARPTVYGGFTRAQVDSPTKSYISDLDDALFP